MAQWWERSSLTNEAWARFQAGTICGLMLLALALLRESFSGFSNSPPYLNKHKHPKFQFDQDRRPPWKPAKARCGFFFVYCHLLGRYIKHSRQCWTTFSNTWNLSLWKMLRYTRHISTSFSLVGNVVKPVRSLRVCVSCFPLIVI